jgi:hypothetical protein
MITKQQVNQLKNKARALELQIAAKERALDNAVAQKSRDYLTSEITKLTETLLNIQIEIETATAPTEVSQATKLIPTSKPTVVAAEPKPQPQPQPKPQPKVEQQPKVEINTQSNQQSLASIANEIAGKSSATLINVLFTGGMLSLIIYILGKLQEMGLLNANNAPIKPNTAAQTAQQANTAQEPNLPVQQPPEDKDLSEESIYEIPVEELISPKRKWTTEQIPTIVDSIILQMSLVTGIPIILNWFKTLKNYNKSLVERFNLLYEMLYKEAVTEWDEFLNKQLIADIMSGNALKAVFFIKNWLNVDINQAQLLFRELLVQKLTKQNKVTSVKEVRSIFNNYFNRVKMRPLPADVAAMIAEYAGDKDPFEVTLELYEGLDFINEPDSSPYFDAYLNRPVIDITEASDVTHQTKVKIDTSKQKMPKSANLAEKVTNIQRKLH